MGSCDRCGDIVNNGESKAAQKAFAFCMKYGLSTRDLYILTDKDVQAGYQTLGQQGKKMLADLAEAAMAASSGNSAASKSKTSTSSKGKSKNK